MPKKILYVDDSVSMRQIISMSLKKEGYEVELASDGNEALSLLAKDRYDAIITDFKMPKMDGLNFVKKVREHPNNRFASLVMLTTEASHEKKIEGKELGVKVWVNKPIHPDKLNGIMKKLIGH